MLSTSEGGDLAPVGIVGGLFWNLVYRQWKQDIGQKMLQQVYILTYGYWLCVVTKKTRSGVGIRFFCRVVFFL